MRETIPINYNWQYFDNCNKQSIVNLPHTNKEVPLNNFNEELSQIKSIYQKEITIDSLEYCYYLQFEGVGHQAKLYINNQYVDEHHCGYTRWKIEITHYLKKGKNDIKVCVDANEVDQPPFGNVIDYLTFGGIYREVFLIKVNKLHFTDNYLTTKNLLSDSKTYELNYTISDKTEAQIKFSLYDEQTKIYENIVNSPNKLRGALPNITLWDLDNPQLYLVKLEIVENNEVVDVIEYKTGFRDIQFNKEGFFLNGKQVKIRGLNRHQMYPVVGYAMPRYVQEDDAIILKERLALNLVRTSHYPNSPYFLNKCDELGLLVFEEIPGWQYVGNEKWKEQSIKNVKDMIIRDRHHPSIIIWGVRINESGDYHDFYQRTNCLARELDPFRATAGVRFFKQSELLEDIYTYNDFLHDGSNKTLADKKEVISDNVPYLITEYGGHMFPTKAYDNEERRMSHSLIHRNVIHQAKITPGVMGAIGWVFADYNTHKDFGSGDMVCHHGVLDMFRNEKLAAYVYETYRKEPLLEISTNFNIGEYTRSTIEKFCIYTNCDLVEMYRNNDLIQTFRIDESLLCRVMEVRDLIGNSLEVKEKLAKEQSDYLKKIIQDIIQVGANNAHEILITKYPDEDITKAWNMYGKYVCDWGNKISTYEFIGYKNNKIVKRVQKGPQYLTKVIVEADRTILKTKDSYDATRITIKAMSNLNNVMPYVFEAFKVKVSDGLEIIGDSLISLQAGMRSFWVKTKNKTGYETVTIHSDRFGDQTVEIIVKEE